MDLLELVNLLELDAEVRSPATPLKLVTIGKVMGLNEQSRVIDFGCGCGEALALWGKYFGVSGTGIDRHRDSCSRAAARLAEGGLSERVRIICMDAAEYAFEEGVYDVASCIGASMIWGGFRPAIREMRRAIHAAGQVVIGEAYFTRSDVPQKLIDYEGPEHTEPELYRIAREEGFEVAYVARGSSDDWDRYAGNCYGDIQRVKAVADPEERQGEWARLHRWQDMYVEYRRSFQRWAVYVLLPVSN